MQTCMKMKRFNIIIIALAVAAAGLVSCGKSCPESQRPQSYRQVFLYYMAGYNNLSSYLLENLSDLERGVLPSKSRDQAILVFSHTTKASYDYTTPNSPCLIQIYREKGRCVADTISVYPESMSSASASTLKTVLEDVRSLFPADSYGMLFSSHATGWLPEGYLNSSARTSASSESLQSYPLTKSVGAQYNGSSRNSEEIELSEFAAAIPMKLDYIIFDACLMGGIEVAWELRDVCDMLVFSPAEVIARGFIYQPISWNLFSGQTPDLGQICRDYFSYYDSQTGQMRSATVSLVDCRNLQPLADCFREILSQHRDMIPFSRDKCQAYFYDSKEYFFDLRDFASCLGATEAELDRLDDALAGCVAFHAETPTFFDLRLERCCGLSTYIPSEDFPVLNSFYKTLAWNSQTGLVE